MKKPKPTNLGAALHAQLIESFSRNPYGLQYNECSRECIEVSYYIYDDRNGTNCFATEKRKNKDPFKIINETRDGANRKSWLVCVDEGLITNQKSRGLPRCDNLVFNDEYFFFIEAKMRVLGELWKREFEDAIENKIPTTKRIIDEILGGYGYTIKQEIKIAIPFPAANLRVPRNNPQKKEVLRLEARKKCGKWVSDIEIHDIIHL